MLYTRYIRLLWDIAGVWFDGEYEISDTKYENCGIRIIKDLVVNHTSDEHPWFVEAKKRRVIHTGTIISGEREKRAARPMGWNPALAAMHGNIRKKRESIICTSIIKSSRI